MNARIPALLLLAVLAALSLSLAGCASSSPPTPKNTKIIARIALLADPHVNLATNGMDATFAAHFATAIAQVNAAKVDLVLIAGDLTQSGKPGEYAAFLSRIKCFQAPVWYVPGNHDTGNKLVGTNGSGTPQRTERYEKLAGPSWFVKSWHGVRVIGINSPVLGSGFACEDKMWNFLEKEFATPAGEPTFLLTHYPLFINDPAEPGGSYWNIEPSPRARLYALLKSGNAKGVFSGHLHRPLLKELNGMQLLTAPPISFGLPAGQQPEGWLLLTVHKTGVIENEFQPLNP